MRLWGPEVSWELPELSNCSLKRVHACLVFHIKTFNPGPTGENEADVCTSNSWRLLEGTSKPALRLVDPV